MTGSRLFHALIGQRVKLVVQEPYQPKPRTYYGAIEGVEDNFLLFRSAQGLGSFNIQYIIAVKPQEGGGR